MTGLREIQESFTSAFLAPVARVQYGVMISRTRKTPLPPRPPWLCVASARDAAAEAGQTPSRKLPVFCWCGRHCLETLHPEPRPLSFVLRLVERLCWQGEFFGLDLDGRITFQVCAEYDRPLWLRAELLDTATLTLAHARVERAHVVLAVHVAFTSRDVRAALCDPRLRWRQTQLGRGFAE